MLKALLAALAIAAAGGGTAAGVYFAVPRGEEEVAPRVARGTATPTPAAPATALPTLTPSPLAVTPGPGVTLWRWVDVTVLVPDNSGVYVVRDSAHPDEHPPDGGLVLRIRRGDAEAVVDAQTGKVIRQYAAEADRPFIEAALVTIRVGDPMTGDPLPWPYGEIPPTTPKVQQQPGSIRYWEPDPASGIALVFGCEGVGGSRCFVLISNGPSTRAVYIDTGEIITSLDEIAPGDADAFDRWRQAIDLPGS